jgi:hypothetical protein
VPGFASLFRQRGRDRSHWTQPVAQQQEWLLQGDVINSTFALHLRIRMEIVMSTTTTIRLPEDLKARIATAAERAGKTTHSFILKQSQKRLSWRSNEPTSMPKPTHGLPRS